MITALSGEHFAKIVKYYIGDNQVCHCLRSGECFKAINKIEEMTKDREKVVLHKMGKSVSRCHSMSRPLQPILYFFHMLGESFFHIYFQYLIN